MAIGIYKLGQSKYNDKPDKNSGLYEKNLIVRKLQNATNETIADLNVTQNTNNIDKLIILNGIEDYHDYDVINPQSLKKVSKTIFLKTDIDANKHNNNFIKMSDIVLDQIPTKNYSYIPELFYKECYAPINQKKNDVLFFGGTEENREDDFREYILRDKYFKTIKKEVVFYGKISKDGIISDNRLPYREYIRQLRMHKFTIIIVDWRCRANGWVTSRFVEAISNNVVPFVDVKYDKNCHFVNSSSYLRVGSWKEVVYKMEYINKMDETSNMSEEILQQYKKLISYRQSKFIDIIMK